MGIVGNDKIIGALFCIIDNNDEIQQDKWSLKLRTKLKNKTLHVLTVEIRKVLAFSQKQKPFILNLYYFIIRY